MDNKIGLVLAGGGGKGAYHIGVWRALRQYGAGKNISSISGTSVGALNAALFAVGDYDLAEDIWLNLSYDKVLSVDKKNLISSLMSLGLGGIRLSVAVLSAMSGAGFFTRKGLTEIMSRLDFDSLRYSDKNIFAGVYNISRMQMEYLPLNGQSNDRVQKILLASSALPIIYPPENIDGSKYIDGGVSDNVPVKPIHQNGCKIILAVHLSRDSLINDIQQYDDTKIFEIVPSSDQGNILTGTLDFSREGIRQRMQLGYDDTCRILEPIYNMGMIQKKFSFVAKRMLEDEQVTRQKLSSLATERENIYNEREILKQDLRKVIDFE